VMVHGDNKGLVLPPRVACIQAVIIPCGITGALSSEDKRVLLDLCKEYEDKLCESGIRSKLDQRDHVTSGWKFNDWELRGVPIRIEIGPRDMKQQTFVAVRRDNNEKITYQQSNLVKDVRNLLEQIHNNLFQRAKKEYDSHYVVCSDWNEFCSKLDEKCVLLAPFCGGISCEDKIKADSAKDENQATDVQAPAMGAKSLCIPFHEANRKFPANARCIHPSCDSAPKFWTMFGRSY